MFPSMFFKNLEATLQQAKDQYMQLDHGTPISAYQMGKIQALDAALTRYRIYQKDVKTALENHDTDSDDEDMQITLMDEAIDSLEKLPCEKLMNPHVNRWHFAGYVQAIDWAVSEWQHCYYASIELADLTRDQEGIAKAISHHQTQGGNKQ